MGLLSMILETMLGKAKIVVFSGKKPAAEITIEGRDISVEIKNPLLALHLGITEFLKMRERDPESMPGLLKEVKKMGYTVRIKYGRLEMDI